jgi:pyruvate kinase
LRVPRDWLAGTHSGDGIRFTDLRGRSRTLELGSAVGGSRWATSARTAYLGCGTLLRLTLIPKAVQHEKSVTDAAVEPPPPGQQFIILKPDDVLVLTRAPLLGRPAVCDERGRVLTPATIPCTLPEVFQDLKPKETIWFDDGRIGGVIESADAETVRLRVTSAASTGDKLRPDKGINFPDSTLRLPALTDKDIADLDFVVQHADLVGLSFVKRPDDVRALQAQLARRGAEQLGVVLKIETRVGFEQLPSLLLAAMSGPRVGVMIARGDLAVECGWERLAEAQEEILWVCEAAHIPVIWATQVLEGLAKKGVPSRAEITDAAMGERAECVMLNKGPHLATAVRVLDDILRRMEAHQSKKTARLRPLRLSAIVPT